MGVLGRTSINKSTYLPYFLIAALDYLGKRVAQLQSGLEEPTENELREARRLVLQHCIYGVDKNLLAVELAKISLWLHAFVRD